MFEYNALVGSVVDGDTVKLAVDLGFGIWSTQVVRLAGINAPELHGQPDPEPGKAAKRYLENRLPISTKVRIKTTKDKREKYGRLLAEIWVDPDLISVNKEMIDAGHAVPYSGGER
jgi:endonuclease YncB( thermonuclease family)